MDKPQDSVITAALDAWEESGKRSSIKIAGNSMRPLLGNNSTVIVEHRSNNIHFGDIVVFRREGALITHRIVRVFEQDGKKLFMTKGDRTLKFDPLQHHENEILGKVIGVVKGGKTIVFEGKYWKVLHCILALCSFTIGSICAFIKRLR